MKYHVVFFLFVSLHHNATSQGLTGGVENQNNLNQIASTGDPTQVVRQYDERYAGVKGTPYLLERFSSGQVKLKSGAIYFSQFINYDCVNDDLVFKKDGSSPEMIVKRDLIESFQIDSSSVNSGSRKMIMLNLESREQGFYEILYTGKHICVFQKTVKRLIKADFKGAYSMGTNYDRFDQDVDVFSYKDGILNPIKLNAKSISALFPDRSEEVFSFIKKNKLNPKEKSELNQIMAYGESF